jgi:hypothetical protein
MSAAVHVLDEKLHVWQVAAQRAGLPDEEVRVLHETQLVYLIGQEWVVSNQGGHWKVRRWEGTADDLYDSAQEMEALDDPDDPGY